MFTNKAWLFVGAAFGFLTLGAQAQSGTSSGAATNPTAGIDTCIIGCVTSAASSAGCSSFTDLTCVCTSASFQTAAASCLQTNCTSSDVQSALQLQQAECASVSGATSIPLSTTGTASSGASTGTAPASGTSGSAAATSSSAAGSNVRLGGEGFTTAAIVGLFGIVVGALAI